MSTLSLGSVLRLVCSCRHAFGNGMERSSFTSLLPMFAPSKSTNRDPSITNIGLPVVVVPAVMGRHLSGFAREISPWLPEDTWHGDLNAFKRRVGWRVRHAGGVAS